MSEDRKVMVKALRPFDGAEGYKDETSEPFGVDDRRFAELKASGLVAPTGSDAVAEGEGPEAKRAPEPLNKMAPAASNKDDGGNASEGTASDTAVLASTSRRNRAARAD